VQETDVIEAGGPATVNVYPLSGQRTVLFFLSPEDRLTPVSRPIEDGELPATEPKPVDGPTALAALFAGPRANEREAGLHTRLPQLKGKAEVESTTGELIIRLPLPVRPLAKNAVRQVVCTAAVAWSDPGVEVTLEGHDGALPSARC
jgi:hypothetical protein